MTDHFNPFEFVRETSATAILNGRGADQLIGSRELRNDVFCGNS